MVGEDRTRPETNRPQTRRNHTQNRQTPDGSKPNQLTERYWRWAVLGPMPFTWFSSQPRRGPHTATVTASFGTSMDIAAGFVDDDQPAIGVEIMQRKELFGYYAYGTGYGGQVVVRRTSLAPICSIRRWVNNHPRRSLRRLGRHAADAAVFAVESIRRWWGPDGRGPVPGCRPAPRGGTNRPPHLGHYDQSRAHHPSRLPPQLVSKGVRIADSEFAAALPVDRRDWERDWNYTSAPRSSVRLGSVR